jgi:hypothetical protein
MSQPILVDRTSDGVATVTMNRPERMNSLTSDLLADKKEWSAAAKGVAAAYVSAATDTIHIESWVRPANPTPTSLPVINWNGVADEKSISAMRVSFSSRAYGSMRQLHRQSRRWPQMT